MLLVTLANLPEFSAIQNPGWFVFNLFPIETIGLVYLPSHLPQKSTKCSKYTSPMDPCRLENYYMIKLGNLPKTNLRK